MLILYNEAAVAALVPEGIFSIMKNENPSIQLSLFELSTMNKKDNRYGVSTRRLKVCCGYYHATGKRYGVINLRGHYLAKKAGFLIGDMVEVQITRPGQLLITKLTDEIPGKIDTK